MSILIAGGDRLPDWLKRCADVYHWSGRGAHRDPIPESVTLVILRTDYLKHSLAYRLKREAARKGLRLVYARSMAGLKGEIGREVEE